MRHTSQGLEGLHGSLTTGFTGFAECRLHSAKASLHSANSLPSVTLDKRHSAKPPTAKGSLPSVGFRALGKDFAESLGLPRACIRQRPGMPCARFLPSVRGLALGKPHLHLLHTPGPQKNPSVSRPRAFHQAFGPCLERGGGCHPTSEPRGVFLAWSCRGATARPRPWTSRRAASGSAYAASPTATVRAGTRPAPWRRGRCWRSGGAREAPKRGAAGCGGRRWTRPPAAAAAAAAAAVVAAAAAMARARGESVGIGMGRGVRGSPSRSRLGGVAAALETVRVVWEPTSRRAPRGGSGWPRSRYHLFACAYEICDLNIVPLILQVCKCSSTEK